MSSMVLEARERVGGRVHSRTLANGAVVEMGAEFILPGCDVVPARRPSGSASGSGTRACATGAATRAAPRCRRARSKRQSRQSTPRSPRRIAGRGRAPPRLLGRLEIDPGAREAILARAEVSAAAPAEHGRPPPSSACLPASATSRRRESPAATSASPMALAGALPARRGAARRAGPRPSLTGADGVVVRTGAGEIAADACVVAVPPPLVESARVRAGAAGRLPGGARLGRLRPRREAVRAAGGARAAERDPGGGRPLLGLDGDRGRRCAAAGRQRLRRLGAGA